MSPVKISIRFYKDREVRAVWIDESNEWNFSVLDLMAVFNDESDYAKNRNYWKYFKKKLVQENPQLVSPTTQLKSLRKWPPAYKIVSSASTTNRRMASTCLRSLPTYLSRWAWPEPVARVDFVSSSSIHFLVCCVK